MSVAEGAMEAARRTREFACAAFGVPPEARESYTAAIVLAVRTHLVRSYEAALASMAAAVFSARTRAHELAADRDRARAELTAERIDRVMANQMVRGVFRRLGTVMATSATDWGQHSGQAWLYGVLLGWECEGDCIDPGEPGHRCGQTLEAMAARHGWSAASVEQLRAHRAAVREVTE